MGPARGGGYGLLRAPRGKGRNKRGSGERGFGPPSAKKDISNLTQRGGGLQAEQRSAGEKNTQNKRPGGALSNTGSRGGVGPDPKKNTPQPKLSERVWLFF